MRHSPALFAAALCTALLAPAAPAAFSGHFHGLESWLAVVEDSPPAGTRESRREHRAAARALLLLHRPAEDLGDDLLTARRMSKVLRRGWRGEGKGMLAPPLEEVFAEAVDNLREAVQQDLGFLASSCGGQPRETRDSIDACIERARSHVEDAVGGAPSFRIRHLLKARREWEKGSRSLSLAGPPETTITATRAGEPVLFDEVLVAWSPAAGALPLSAIRATPPSASLVAMAAGPVTGPGTYPLVMGHLDEEGTLPLGAESGTFEVLALDEVAGTLSLRVSFLGEGPPGSGVSGEVVLEYTGPFFTGD